MEASMDERSGGCAVSRRSSCEAAVMIVLEITMNMISSNSKSLLLKKDCIRQVELLSGGTKRATSEHVCIVTYT